MMEQRRVQSFTSSPHQYVVGYPGSHHLSRCDSHEPITSKPGHRSFDEQSYTHPYSQEPATTRSLSASVDAFDPWILVEPPCASPMSTSSSISHAESVPTPPYTGMAMYNQADAPAFRHVRSSSSHEAWSGEPEPVWRPSYPDINTWGSQQFSLPYHEGPICNQLQMQPVQSYIPQAAPSVAAPYISYPASIQYSAPENVELAPLKQDLVKQSEDSDMDSDSESEESESDDDDSSHKSSSSNSRGSGANSSVMKLGKWSNMACSFSTASEPRPYVCPLEDKNHSGNPCSGRFVRPEHLRRHVRTVHGDVRNHFCKVCLRPFSRGDNLRDHYWTHLDRGGRSGKNEKMTLLQLKAILGPKEKLLVKRLKMKLQNTRTKQIKSKH